MSNTDTIQPTTDLPTIQWQYQFVELSKWNQVQATLDSFSAEGFELVNFVQGPTGPKLIFKRACG